MTRDLVYLRYPIADSGGIHPGCYAATDAVAGLALSDSTLIKCSGMSRSPAIAAMALAWATGRPPEDCLAALATHGPIDVSPALWSDLRATSHARDGEFSILAFRSAGPRALYAEQMELHYLRLTDGDQ